MNSEGDYSMCNLEAHHGYPSGPTATYGPGTLDIYGGFHQSHHQHTGRSSLDAGQQTGYYGSGDASLSPQLGTPGELPSLSSGGTHHHHQGSLAGYASAAGSGLHTSRGSSSGSTRGGQQSGYPHTIPAAHTHHHHHQQQNGSHQQHHHQQIHNSSGSTATTTDGISNTTTNNNSLHYSAGTQMPHDLAAMTASDLYHSSASPHHAHHPHQHPHQVHASISSTPNFLEVSAAAGSHMGMRTPPGYHHHHHQHSSASAGSVLDQKYSLQAQLSGHSVVTGAGLTNGYLPPPPPTSSPLKSESGGGSQPGLQGKPFRWMTIKRTPAKPGEYWTSLLD